MIKIELVQSTAGVCLVIDGTRVSGPKPWGGGKTIKSFDVDLSILKKVVCGLKEIRE